MSEPLHVTIVYDGTEYKLLPGVPSDHGLPTATAAHTFSIGEAEAVFWTVGCELTGEEIREMARRWLSEL